eukprot:gene26368-35006_t
MGAKKKKGKKDEVDQEAPKPPPPPKRDNWINIEFKLLNWKFMNFSMRFKDETHIFSLKKILHERHGKLDDLKLCFHAFNEENEINNEMLTLKELGLKSCFVDIDNKEEAMTIPTVQLFYDFKPTNFSDPVILYFK